MYWCKIEEEHKGQSPVLVADQSFHVAVAIWHRGHWIDVTTSIEIDFEPTHFSPWEQPKTVLEAEEAAGHGVFSQAEYDKILRAVVTASYWYYVKAQPILGDQAFDGLFRRLKEIEQSGKVQVSEWSPVSRVLGEREENYPDWAKKSV